MRILFTLSAALLCLTGMAQLTGTVVDKNEEPLPNASVALYQGDEIVDGVSTEVDGTFSLDAPTGEYRLRVTYVSYREKRLSVNVEEGESKHLGNIVLREAMETLDEATVEGRANMVEFQQDKRVFNVGKDLTNVGNSASEVLDNIPSVVVGVEGEVSLRGSQNVRILINGKPSGLIGDDPAAALRQIQSELIEKVEVITNPSARYDAEGEAGIINIVLKKQDEAGLNGSIDVTGGYPDLYGAGAQLNYRKNKLNFFTNISMRYDNSPGNGFSNQQFTRDDTSYSFIRDRHQMRGGVRGTFRFGADYSLTDNQTLTGSFLYQPSNDENIIRLNYRDLDADGSLQREVNRVDREQEDESTYEGNINWTKNFEDHEDHKWTADFQFTREDELEASDITQDTIGRPGQLRQDVENTQDQSRYLIQSDYVKPFSDKRSLELGTRLTLRTIENNFQVNNIDEGGGFDPIDTLTNRFNFIENVYAAYGIYNGQFSDDFTFQTGLRAEFTDITTRLQDEPDNQRDYFNLFPSAFLTYSFSPLSDLQVSYSRRINRPGFWTLAPFFSYSDNRNFFSGNPNVNPEFADSYQMGYIRYFEKGNIYSGIYYRHRTDVVERIRTVDDDGVTQIFPVNLGTQDAYGFEFNFQYEFTDWYSVVGDLNLFRAITVGTYQNQNFGADNYSSNGRLMNRISFWNSDLQLSFNFRGASTTPQGRNLGRYTMNLGWSKELFNKKATLTVSVRDLFNTRYRRSYTSGEDWQTYSRFQWRERQLSINFTYRLNQRKRPGSPDGEGPGGYDDGGDF